MLTKDYFIEINPYTKHAELDKYYLDQHKENCTKLSKRGDGNPDYKLLASMGGMFCIYFYVLSLIAQQCLTFFITTFLLNTATALQCQHYAYHLVHFLFAHFFTFASKLLFDKISQLIYRLFTKVYRFAKNKHLSLSSLKFGNLYKLLRKCKIRRLLLWKVEKAEDEKSLINNFANKNRKRRKIERLLTRNFFEHLQHGAYKKFKSSRNFYHKLTPDHKPFSLNSNDIFNNMNAVNNWTRNFEVLTIYEVNYVEVSRTPINGTQALLANPGPSQDQGSTDYTDNNAGFYGKENINSAPPCKHTFGSGWSKREPEKMKVKDNQNTISRDNNNNRNSDLKNINVTKCCEKCGEAVLVCSKEKRKFNWKKRHKDLEKSRDLKNDKKTKRTTKMKSVRGVVCECYKYDYLLEDVDEIKDEETEWFKTQYEKSIGKTMEASIPRKNVLKRLKCQARCLRWWSPTALGYRHQVKLKQKPLELDWGKSPTAKLCTCPLTDCTCEGNSLAAPINIPRGRVCSLKLPGVVVVRLLHEACGCCCDCLLKKYAPAPARTLFPRLRDAVSTKRMRYKLEGSADMPAEFCASGCKNFFFKTDKLDFDDVAGSRPMIEDGLVEQEIEGAGETPIYSKDDNIYARGFNLTISTQTEFDKKGRLLREDTDRLKIPFTLRYVTRKDLEGIKEFEPCAPLLPTCDMTLETLLHVPDLKEHITKVKKGIEGFFSFYFIHKYK